MGTCSAGRVDDRICDAALYNAGDEDNISQDNDFACFHAFVWMLDMLKPLGIKEIVRSGRIALSRGIKSIN